MPDPVFIVARALTTAEVDAEIDVILERPYSYAITPDPEVGGFAASILEFPGCFAQGQTVDGAYANIRSAAREWLRILIRQGKDVPPPLDPSARLVPLEVPHDVFAAVQRAAASKRLTASDLVLRMLTERFPPPCVHIIFEGRALCGKKGQPGSWEEGQRCVRLEDNLLATCDECRLRAPEFMKLL